MYGVYCKHLKCCFTFNQIIIRLYLCVQICCSCTGFFKFSPITFQYNFEETTISAEKILKTSKCGGIWQIRVKWTSVWNVFPDSYCLLLHAINNKCLQLDFRQLYDPHSNGDPMECRSYRVIKLLECAMKVIERVFGWGIGESTDQ